MMMIINLKGLHTVQLVEEGHTCLPRKVLVMGMCPGYRVEGGKRRWFQDLSR